METATKTQDLIQSGQTYRHYKGGLYKILHLARYEVDERAVVVYQDVKHPEKIWVRDLDVFLETVKIDGNLAKRFALVDSV